jgi:hypothetical protein
MTTLLPDGFWRCDKCRRVCPYEMEYCDACTKRRMRDEYLAEGFSAYHCDEKKDLSIEPLIKSAIKEKKAVYDPRNKCAIAAFLAGLKSIGRDQSSSVEEFLEFLCEIGCFQDYPEIHGQLLNGEPCNVEIFEILGLLFGVRVVIIPDLGSPFVCGSKLSRNEILVSHKSGSVGHYTFLG